MNETTGYLIRWSDEIYGFHGRKRLTTLGYVLNNWRKKQKVMEESTFEPNRYILQCDFVLQEYNSLVIPSDIMSVILQHDEIILMLSLSTTKT